MYGTVEHTEQLAPRMVRVVLGGEGLDGFPTPDDTDAYVNLLFVPPDAGYAAPFDLDEARARPRVERPIGRRYTVRAWDPEQRRLTIDFVVHGDVGIAGPWAMAAQPGDRIQFAGPSSGYAPDPDADWHLMAGDESALPAIAASLERVPAGRPAMTVLVVDGLDHELDLACGGELSLTWLHRHDHPGDTDLLVSAVGALDFPEGQVDVFVHGEAGETRAVLRHLLGERGIEKASTSISPYWRRSFTDERWREVKADWLAEVEADI